MLREVLQRLKSFESTWAEIDGPTGGHSVETRRIGRAARGRLTEIQQDDAEALFSLRVTGRRRVWGILDEHVLKVLWWDPEHEVYPVEKRHT